MLERIIGRYTHGAQGPLLIVLSAIHGNEPAGVKALDYLFKMLEVEPITNPGFQFHGEIIGLIGNLKALQLNKRFIDHDLNRIWTKDLEEEQGLRIHEQQEKQQIIEIIDHAIRLNPERPIVILDLHTTSSDGGIFTIPGKGHVSLEIAKGLHAPVILNMLTDIKGTIMEYYNEENLGLTIHSLTFESGSHTDPLSTNRAIAAIINCMRHLDMVNSTDVESIHDDILEQYSKGLPKVTKLVYRHAINNGDDFKMNPGYLNFQAIKEHEPLATHNHIPVTSPYTGKILMPLYQQQGTDGFYIVEEV